MFSPAQFARSKYILATLAVFVMSCSGDTAVEEGSVYQLYYLGGQSNMDGYGYVGELSADLNAPVPGVRIFHGNTVPDDSSGGGIGYWSELQPGHGVGFSSDGAENSYSERFGVEQTFALRLLELDPDAKIAILKYSRGGTSIDSAAAGGFGSWDPDYGGGDGVNQYDHFLNSVGYATSVGDIDGDGTPDTLVPAGILWMQGESDAAYTEEIAAGYLDNLTQLMGLLRAAFHTTDELPIVIGRISDSGQGDDGLVWDYGEIVRAAQAAFVESDAKASLVTSTDEYSYSDPWHYDTEGYIDLGRQFADAVVGLREGR